MITSEEQMQINHEIRKMALTIAPEGVMYLYKLTCLVNWKVYIGQTNDIRMRYYQYRHDSKQETSETAIGKALIKYGIDNFSYEHIASCQTQEDANGVEKALIVQYGSHISLGNGYNVDWGGNNGPSSEETRKKISEGLQRFYAENENKNKGQKRTDEQKQRMSKAAMGKPGTNTGKTFSDGWRKKISDSLIEIPRPENRRFTEEKEKEICELYINGTSTYGLADKFDSGLSSYWIF